MWEKQQEICIFSSSSFGCLQLPSKRRKYLLLKTEKIIFLPWLYSSGVIWLVLRALVRGGNSMSEKRRLEECLLNQLGNPERPIKRHTNCLSVLVTVLLCARKLNMCIIIESLFSSCKVLKCLATNAVLRLTTDVRSCQLDCMSADIRSVLLFHSWDIYRTSLSIRDVILYNATIGICLMLQISRYGSVFGF